MATIRNWVGGNHNFFAASSWTPAGRPVAGDTTVIGLGTASNPNVAVVQNATLHNLTVALDDGASTKDLAVNPTLSLSNATVGSGTSINAGANFNYNPYPFLETIKVAGHVMNQGTISENDLFNKLNIILANNAVLTNQGGTISASDYDTLNIAGGTHATLCNNGTVAGHGAAINIAMPVSGQGAFDLTDGNGFNTASRNESTLEFHQGVSTGQTVTLNDSTLILDSPMSFLGTIADPNVNPAGPYAGNSSVLLANEQAAGLSFHNNVLTVSNGSSVLARLDFAPGLAADDFTFNGITGGGTLPGGTDIHIQLPSATAQIASLSVAPAQNQV